MGEYDGPTPCYYCGLPATCIDHVVPLSLINSLEDADLLEIMLNRRRRLTVDACHECNALLGGRYFPLLSERVAYVKKRLAKRHDALSLRTLRERGLDPSRLLAIPDDFHP